MARASRLEPDWFSFPLAIRCESSRLEGWIRAAPFPLSLRSRLQKYIEEELSGARRRCAGNYHHQQAHGGRGRREPKAMRNLPAKNRRAGGESVLGIRPFSRNWSYRILTSLPLSFSSYWPMQRVSWCIILHSRICCPGSASLTKKSLVAASIVEKPLNGRGRADQQNNLPRSLN